MVAWCLCPWRPTYSRLDSPLLETLEERWGASMAPPDSDASSWIWLPQSLLDEKNDHDYANADDLAPIADVLRHRNNFRLQDTSSTTLSWKPFGYVKKRELEAELWPGLERGYSREYVHWVWYKRGSEDMNYDIQMGFRKDTGRFAPDIPDQLDMKRARRRPTKYTADIKLEPSRQSTLHMVHYCVEGATGDRDTDISIIPGVKAHRWLKGWRGLE